MGRPRQSTCHLGHPLSPANVRLNAAGSQECLVCARRRSRDWARRHRASQSTVDDKQPPKFALVMWASPNLHAFWTYHHTHADAAAHAPTDAPFTVVDTSRRPWIHPLSVGKGVPMNPRELARLQAAFAANEWVSCCVCDAAIAWTEREHPASRLA